MTTLRDITDTAEWSTLGTTVVHFLWQGAIIGLAAAGIAWPYLRTPDVSGRPSFVILLVDTLRADHLGMYGYHRETSPTLDRWAAQSSLFEAGISQASWTKPSVASKPGKGSPLCAWRES